MTTLYFEEKYKRTKNTDEKHKGKNPYLLQTYMIKTQKYGSLGLDFYHNQCEVEASHQIIVFV